MNSIKNQKFGFSLLELILAIAIFSFTSIVLATLLIDSNLSTKLNLERTEVLFYTREGLEAARSIRDNNWADLINGDYGLQDTGSAWVFSGTSDLINDKYTRVINIADIDPFATSSKMITATVSWAFTPSRLATITLKTILTNWRND